MSLTTSPLQQAERLEWVDGSALTWRDLRDTVAAEEAMLALHMRAVHEAWGVALGLTTILAPDRRSVLVTPGFAITCLGMTILLPAARAIAGPAATGAGQWDVVLDAPTLGGGDPCYRPTTCDLEAPPRVASVRWHPAEEKLDQRTGVVLARYTRLATGHLEGPDLSVRRGARVLERPHIGSGSVSGTSLSWSGSGDRLLATIDTSGAGFTRPAVYRVWVAAHAAFPPNVIGALLSVVSVSRGSVQVQLLVPGGASLIVARGVARGLSLGWLGVEPVRGCPPAFSLSQVIAVQGARLDLSVWSQALAVFPGFHP